MLLQLAERCARRRTPVLVLSTSARLLCSAAAADGSKSNTRASSLALQLDSPYFTS